MHVLGFDPHAFAHFRDERKRRRSRVLDHTIMYYQNLALAVEELEWGRALCKCEACSSAGCRNGLRQKFGADSHESCATACCNALKRALWGKVYTFFCSCGELLLSYGSNPVRIFCPQAFSDEFYGLELEDGGGRGTAGLKMLRCCIFALPTDVWLDSGCALLFLII